MENINMTEFEIKLNHDLGLLSELEKFYTKEEQEKYGVLGIRFEI